MSIPRGRSFRFVVSLGCLVALALPATTAGAARSSAISLTFRPGAPSGGGVINSLAVVNDGSAEDVAAGADIAGIHWSGDGGASFQPRRAQMANGDLSVATVVASTVTPGLLYMGTGEGTCRNSRVWSSSDDGRDWQLVGGPPPADCTTTPYPSFDGISAPEQFRSTGRLIATTPGFIYAATYQDGVLRSSDGGLTWTRIWDTVNDPRVGPGHPLRSIAIPAATPGYAYVAVYGDGVFLSKNAGSASPTFAPIGSAPNTKLLYPEELVVANGIMYGVFQALNGATGGIFNYDPTVPRWKALANPDPSGAATWFSIDAYRDSKTHLVVGCTAACPVSGGVSEDVFQSDNGGVAWTSLVSSTDVSTNLCDSSTPYWMSLPGGHSDFMLGQRNFAVDQVVFDPSHTHVYVGGTDLWRYDAVAAQWAPCANGLMTSVLTSVAVGPDPADDVYAGAGDWSFFVSTDGGTTAARNWPHTPTSPVNAKGLALAVDAPTGTVYVSESDDTPGQSGELFDTPSPTTPSSWTALGLSAADGDWPAQALAEGSIGGNQFVLAAVPSSDANSGIWRYDPSQVPHWHEVQPIPLLGPAPSLSWVAGQHVAYLYDRSDGGALDGALWISTDDGKTWTKTAWHGAGKYGRSGFVAADPTAPSTTVYASVDSGLHLLTISGTTVAGDTVIHGPKYPGPLFVQSDGRVWVTTQPQGLTGDPAFQSAELFTFPKGGTPAEVEDAEYHEIGGYGVGLAVANGPGGGCHVYVALRNAGMIVGTSPTACV